MYTFYALLISIAVGGISSAVFAALWQHEKAQRAVAEAATALANAAAAENKKQAVASENGRMMEIARGNAAVQDLKQEVASLEADLQTCRDPDAVRARLRKLLGA